MKPTEILVEEHNLIKRAIAVLESAGRRLQDGDDTIIDVYPVLIDFIRDFADARHHGKEEDLLFKVLMNRGMPAGGPIDVMLHEHDRGRTFVKNMSEAVEKFRAGDKSARNIIIINGEGYANLLKAHIQKEDLVLYPMADNILNDDDQADLDAGFARVEETFGPEQRRRFEELLDDLENQLGVP